MYRLTVNPDLFTPSKWWIIFGKLDIKTYQIYHDVKIENINKTVVKYIETT